MCWNGMTAVLKEGLYSLIVYILANSKLVSSLIFQHNYDCDCNQQIFCTCINLCMHDLQQYLEALSLLMPHTALSTCMPYNAVTSLYVSSDEGVL